MQTQQTLVQFSRLACRASFQVLSGNVILIRATGPISCSAVQDIGRAVNEKFGQSARGWVFDYSRAVLTATDAELRQLTATAYFDAWKRPAAYVGNPEAMPQLQEQALRLARKGFDRRCFDTVERAHEWISWMNARA